MELSNEQKTALSLIEKWLKSTSPIFKLYGLAGTGKSTIAKLVAEKINGDVYFAAYTGKAAHVMRQYGCKNATTIHKLIYLPKSKAKKLLKELSTEQSILLGKSTLTRKEAARLGQIALEMKRLSSPNWELDRTSVLANSNTKLVVIDECSMLSKNMLDDLLSFNKKVLVLGDPGQLPPVFGNSAFINDKPNFTLLQIHRQAKDNPIIDLAHRVRNFENLKLGTYGNSSVIDRESVNKEMILGFDQILVWRNKSKDATNKKYRTLLGITNLFPVKDERLICLRNNHDEQLFNGQTFVTIKDSYPENDSVHLELKNDEEETIETLAQANYFRYGAKDYDSTYNEFDFSYAMTVHKSQGSQWDKVIIFDNYKARDREKWLYTAITRASNSVTIVKM